jgi:molybdenum cofactor cytidylyltransferase
MTIDRLQVAVILLAAGLSRRMGERNKLLIQIEGEPLVRRTAKAYLTAGVEVRAVLGHEAEQVRAVLTDLPLTFVENPHFAEGQPSSVRAGLESLTGGHDAILVGLADQAALTSVDICDLVAAFGKSDREHILIPYCRGERGNPVVFPSKIVADIRAAGSSADCRKFIDSNPHLTRHYETANGHFVIDIDTPEDLRAFESASGDTWRG